ncbi:hypothetical protein [Crystallibacter degradans]|uniref:hypothetical protein n=1 Tax=Crystallibacter degradans TaxID=2726743 RepID=UPI0014761D8F|nr:hypothetical protein [Arthrobacter sp. SF27]NMR29939.1 hypothetical protein [Arthrobacter sp. SF27]
MPRKWTNNPKSRHRPDIEPLEAASKPDTPETMARRLVSRGLATIQILDGKRGELMDQSGRR